MRIRREFWQLFTKRISPLQTRRPFCTDKKIGNSLNPISKENGSSTSKEVENVTGSSSSSSLSHHEACKMLENLDFATAAKIAFTTQPRRKKGLDYHIVHFLISLLPSLAVYLVAMYSRSEMRRMEAEVEAKKRVEEEAKAKEMEILAAQELENPSDPHIKEVKGRLDKLEEIIKEIVVESKTRSPGSSPVKDGETASKQPVTNEGKSMDGLSNTAVVSSKQPVTNEGKSMDGSANTAVNSNKQVNAESSSTKISSAPQENQKSS